jgi:AhpD family alkylhydroperoxidase
MSSKKEHTMGTRIDPAKAAPDAYKAVLALENYVRHCGLEMRLFHLVKTRASQINGCAFCIDMHTREARAGGETEQRLYLLDAWRETDLYTRRERAALAWTEAITLIAETHAPDSDWDMVRKEFSDKEVADLTLLIGVINTWNRLSIGFRTMPGKA